MDDNNLLNSPVSDVDEITGDIVRIELIDGELKSYDADISGTISPIEKIDGSLMYGVGDGENVPYYEGAYEATPKAFEETVLETKNKRLLDDITVREISYIETSNVSGGVTVYIA